MQNNMRRVFATVSLAAGITIGSAGAALAVTEYVGGGAWDHGFMGNDYVYSNYYHGSVCHGSTAVGTYTSRASAPAGSTSYAQAPRANSNNETYWRTSC